MRYFILAAALAVGFLAPVQAAEWAPQTFYDRTWVCISPEAYTTAIQREADLPRGQLASLRSKLLEEQLCMMLEEDQIEDMMAPFVQIKEIRGDMVRVEFIIEFYRKIKFLHRRITRVFYTGWTDQANLRNYYEWLTGKPQS